MPGIRVGSPSDIGIPRIRVAPYPHGQGSRTRRPNFRPIDASEEAGRQCAPAADVHVFVDLARAGARSGLARLLRMARAGVFDVVLVEKVDDPPRDATDPEGSSDLFERRGSLPSMPEGSLQVEDTGLAGIMARADRARRLAIRTAARMAPSSKSTGLPPYRNQEA